MKVRKIKGYRQHRLICQAELDIDCTAAAHQFTTTQHYFPATRSRQNCAQFLTLLHESRDGTL